jgi:hypothetical protein
MGSLRSLCLTYAWVVNLMVIRTHCQFADTLCLHCCTCYRWLRRRKADKVSSALLPGLRCWGSTEKKVKWSLAHLVLCRLTFTPIHCSPFYQMLATTKHRLLILSNYISGRMRVWWLECSWCPKIHVLGTWSSAWWHGEVVEPLRGETSGWIDASLTEWTDGSHEWVVIKEQKWH